MRALLVMVLGLALMALGCNKSNPEVASGDDARAAADAEGEDGEGDEEYAPGGGGLVGEDEIPLRSGDEPAAADEGAVDEFSGEDDFGEDDTF